MLGLFVYNDNRQPKRVAQSNSIYYLWSLIKKSYVGKRWAIKPL